MIIKIAKQAAARGINITSSLACAVIIGKSHGAAAFSEYAFSISFINIFSAICLLGFEISINKEYYSNTFTKKKRAAGLITVALTFVAASVSLHFFSAIFQKSLATPALLSASLISSVTFYLANSVKYERSAYAFEFIRGGGINTACLIILLLTPISTPEIESHALVLYGSIGVLITCLALLLPNKRPAEVESTSSTASFIANSINLSLTALVSAIIVSGDLIISKLLLPQQSYETMALLTRISFLLAIPFILLNNSQAVEITKLKDNWPLPKKIATNLIAALTICTATILFSDHYLALFSDAKIGHAEREIIALISISHAVNITSAGLIPYLACNNKKHLNISILAALAFFTLTHFLTLKISVATPELRLSTTIYSTLLFLKLTVITLSIFTFKKRLHK